MMLGELYQSGATPELYKFIMNSSSEMSKASRRKQSKPNRLFANEEGGQVIPASEQRSETSPKISPLPLQVAARDHDVCDKDPMDLSTKASSPAVTDASPSHRLESEKAALLPAVSQPMPCPPDMQMVNFPCHACGEVFPSRAQQEQHISERHSSSDAVTARPSPPGPIFPTAYHRLATDLGLGPIGAAIGAAGLMPQLSAAKESSKLLSSTANGSVIPKPGTPGVGGKGTAGTVFQREAYCEICQREFCNKYFLKTHKANIHGIIDPNDPKSAAVAAKVAQAPKISQSMTESLVPQKAPVPSASSKGSAGDSMDDFCEICQKHFCNKYYLKKHKVDVHNIRPDGSKPVSTAAPDSHSDNRGLTTTAPASSGLHLPMMVPPLNPTSMNNMLFVNPFVPSMAAMSMVPPMMQPQFFMPGMGGLPAPHPIAPAVSTSPELKSEPKSASGSEKGDVKPAGDRPETFCNICKKEFCNSYYLQVHKASKHGIFDDPAASALMMMAAEREKAEREGQLMQAVSNSPSPTSMSSMNAVRPVVLTSDNERTKAPAFPMVPGSQMTAGQPVMAPMTFDAMLAAKQADRIACDICNKELCNKYFLKAHKLKMHGVTSSPDEKMAGQMTRESGELATQKPVPQPSPPGADSASPESLAKLGIDPEAYCFLCKKEFCSKYFLKTHKLNIHGIKPDDNARGATPKAPSPQNGLSPSSLLGYNNIPALSDAMMQWKWKDHSQRGVPASLHDSKGANSDKFTWRWKESANSTRVFCDICNKELCNKYFLRTHKQKIHGITDTSSPAKSGRTAAAVTTGGSTMLDMTKVNAAAARATSKQSHAQISSSTTAETLQGHHSPLSQSQSLSPSALDKAQSIRDTVCQVCGMVFSNAEAVNEHVRSEHNGNVQTMEQQADNNNGHTDSQVYTCSQCPFKTSVLINLYQHEARKHNTETNTCKICNVTFSHISMLIKHVRKIHTKTVSASAMKRLSVDSSSQKLRRNVQCNFCSERFLTRQLCQSHIRNTHDIKMPLTSKQLGTTEKRMFACDKCRYVCKSIRNLRAHQMVRHRDGNKKNGSHSPTVTDQQQEIVMQSFMITEVSGLESLAATTVKLPVYEEIKDQVQVNITLKPTLKESLSRERELMDTSTS